MEPRSGHSLISGWEQNTALIAASLRKLLLFPVEGRRQFERVYPRSPLSVNLHRGVELAALRAATGAGGDALEEITRGRRSSAGFTPALPANPVSLASRPRVSLAPGRSWPQRWEPRRETTPRTQKTTFLGRDRCGAAVTPALPPEPGGAPRTRAHARSRAQGRAQPPRGGPGVAARTPPPGKRAAQPPPAPSGRPRGAQWGARTSAHSHTDTDGGWLAGSRTQARTRAHTHTQRQRRALAPSVVPARPAFTPRPDIGSQGPPRRCPAISA